MKGLKRVTQMNLPTQVIWPCPNITSQEWHGHKVPNEPAQELTKFKLIWYVESYYQSDNLDSK